MAAKQIDLSALNIQQLQQLSQQIDQEIEFFTSSLSQLKMAQQKFVESQDCLGRISPETDGKDVLVPLTSSMYVPGKLSDVSNVLVDIGTGYYVEQEVENAKQYFQRKVDYLTKQMEKLQPILQDKYRTKQAVMEVLQLRVQAQLAAQQQSYAAAAQTGAAKS
ncbi:prefoldin subunit 5 [Lingula anatina]|uniref:Prefoldin subunit 5 n=1 Tax=Lingula anatina TaxID=7574 RepID=A0A1S3IKM5_LINAN|nr:prefoldin subunit 5 [Lingula anatina]|eukprot:XP_013398795.1 prefoldin subunit 5 [Lingula anatina]